MELFDFHASCGADLYRPLMAHLKAKRLGEDSPTYVPTWDLCALHKLARLATLLHDAAFFEEASHLSAWILSFKSFPSLWCKEKEFDEKKIISSFERLKNINPVEGRKYEHNATLLKTAKMDAVLTLDGSQTSLGVINSGIEIRAFGPQADPLSFGINGKGMDGWTRSFADPEVWLEMKHRMEDDNLILDFRFVGIRPEKPLFLAFYVKANLCQVGGQELQPKSLKRYLGETSKIQLDNCFIKTDQPQKVEVIPLAGGGCFWDTEFLVSYPLSPFVPQFSVKILFNP